MSSENGREIPWISNPGSPFLQKISALLFSCFPSFSLLFFSPFDLSAVPLLYSRSYLCEKGVVKQSSQWSSWNPFFVGFLKPLDGLILDPSWCFWLLLRVPVLRGLKGKKKCKKMGGNRKRNGAAIFPCTVFWFAPSYEGEGMAACSKFFFLKKTDLIFVFFLFCFSFLSNELMN